MNTVIIFSLLLTIIIPRNILPTEGLQNHVTNEAGYQNVGIQVGKRFDPKDFARTWKDGYDKESTSEKPLESEQEDAQEVKYADAELTRKDGTAPGSEKEAYEATKKDPQPQAEEPQGTDQFAGQMVRKSLDIAALKAKGFDPERRGIAITGKLNLWEDQSVQITAGLSAGGFLAEGYMKELAVGPLKVSGLGADGKEGTADDGVIVRAEFTDKKQQVIASGFAEILGQRAGIDLIFGSNGFYFNTMIKLLSRFSTEITAKTQGSGKDLDFIIAATVEADLKKFIEKEVLEALNKVTKAATDGMTHAQQDLEKAKKQLDPLRKKRQELEAKIEQIKKRFEKRLADAKKSVKPAEDALNKELQNIEGIKKEIERLRQEIKVGRQKDWNTFNDAFNKVENLYREIEKFRKEITEGRKKDTENLKKAQADVNKLQGDIDAAHAEIKRNGWSALWNGPKIAGLEIAKGVATGALNLAKAAVNGFPVDMDPRIVGLFAGYFPAKGVLIASRAMIKAFPIDMDPRISALFVAYETAKAAIKAAIESLNVAKVAALPGGIADGAEITAIGVQIAGLWMAEKTAELGIEIAKGALSVAKVTVQGFGAISTLALKAVTAGLSIFSITGASVYFSLKDLEHGKLPEVGIEGNFFGVHKTVVIRIDMTKPETFITEIPHAIFKALDPNYSGDTLLKKKIAALKNETEASKEKILTDKQKAAAEKIAQEEAQKEAVRKRKELEEELAKEGQKILEKADTIKKGEGEFGEVPEIKIAKIDTITALKKDTQKG